MSATPTLAAVVQEEPMLRETMAQSRQADT
jgi:hypothetical protein